MPIKIGYIDDQPALIDSLKEALSYFEEVEFIFSATDGDTVLDALTNARELPQVILMDIEMDRTDGIEATYSVKEIFPEIRIIMFTVFDNHEKIFDALLAGASGYLVKDERPSKIVAAIQDAMEGRAPMSPVIAQKTLQHIRNSKQRENQRDMPEDFGLTPRQMEILREIARGRTYQEIADLLFISPKTVRNHIEHIYKKLQVHSKLEAIQLGMRNQWFDED